MKCLWKLPHLFSHACVHHTELFGDFIRCKKCGEIIGAKVPVVHLSNQYMFTPFTAEARLYTTEIYEQYNLLDSDWVSHSINMENT